MGHELDSLYLADGKRLAVVSDSIGLAALPLVCDEAGSWHRARPGDGVAEALLAVLHEAPGESARGRFTLHSWTSRAAVGERAITVDQTNESVIVGDEAVVKWATHLQEGPHPALRRISVLRAAGFRSMPEPWGLVTWQPDGGAETLVVNVDEFLPGAVDGWTWAVELVTAAAGHHIPQPASAVAAAAEVGIVVAELHAALASTATTASQADADRWREEALTTRNDACGLSTPATAMVLRQRNAEIERILDGLGALAGEPIIEGHGDLHVGQVLNSNGRYLITDFDGNPVLPPQQRVLPIPAALDVAGMAQSFAHVVIVARHHSDLDEQALIIVDHAVRQEFLQAYRRHLSELGYARIYDPAPLRAFRLQQVLREIVYAAGHLPRWMYVPDSALPALLDEQGIESR